MRNFLFPLCLIVVFGILPYKSISQTFQKSPMEIYSENYTNLPEIYNGGEYIKFLSQSEGHPYFHSKTSQKAEVHYNGILYDDILLLYDLVNHDLIAFNTFHNTNIRINSNRVSRFTYKTDQGNFSFVRKDLISSDENSQNKFLEEIILGKAELYCLYEKSTKEKVEFLDRINTFEPSEKYFLKHLNTFYPIKRKNDLFKLLPIDKKLIKKMLKDNGVKFKSNQRNYFSDILKTFNASES